MPSDPIIQVRNLSKRYHFSLTDQWALFGRRRRENENEEAGFQALQPMSFDVQAGEAVGVIGRNGAGKSTLLQILTGTLRPTTGSVQVKGRVSALLELGAGFNPEFSGRENVFLTGAVLGMSKAEVRRKYDEIVAFADIGEFVERPVKTYSSGMLVRLAFALQVHVDPDVLIVDEALSVGDVFFQQKCINKIREILDQGVTLFFVSHGMNSVKSLCTRALFLRQGELVADGPTDIVCDEYQNGTTNPSGKELEGAIIASQLAGDGSNLTVQEVSNVSALSDEAFQSRVSQRSGSGDVRFSGFKIFDEKGRETSAIEQGGEICIRAEFIAHKDIAPGAVIGILLRDANGVDILALNSDFYGMQLPGLQTGQRYIWEVNVHLPLAKGYYSFHCGVKPAPQGNFFYDRCFNAAVLDIMSNPPSWGEYGGRLLHSPKSIRLLKPKRAS